MEFDVLPVTRYQQNCSILWCEQTMRAAVIDPGGDIPEILNFLELMDLTAEVALITHGHFEHCGGAAQFAELTGARIEGPHIGDAHVIAGLADWAAQHGMPGARSYQPARWLEHGDRVRFGEEVLAKKTPDETEEEANRRAIYILSSHTPAGKDVPHNDWKPL